MKLKNSALFVASLLALAACGMNVPVSERMLQSLFDKMVIATQYDLQCNNGQYTKDPVNENLKGNKEFITSSYKAEILKNRAELKPEDVDVMLEDRAAKMTVRIRELLVNKGCESEAGTRSAEFLDNWVKTAPADTIAETNAKLKELAAK